MLHVSSRIIPASSTSTKRTKLRVCRHFPRPRHRRPCRCERQAIVAPTSIANFRLTIQRQPPNPGATKAFRSSSLWVQSRGTTPMGVFPNANATARPFSETRQQGKWFRHNPTHLQKLFTTMCINAQYLLDPSCSFRFVGHPIGSIRSCAKFGNRVRRRRTHPGHGVFLSLRPHPAVAPDMPARKILRVALEQPGIPAS